MCLKKILLLLPIYMFLLLIPTDVFAFTVYERSGSALTTDPYYDSTNDRYVQEFNPDIVKRVDYGSYTDSTFSTPISLKTVEDENFIGLHYYNCNTFFLAHYKDASGNIVGTLKFEATELVSPTCDSGADGGLGGTKDCSTAICECIAKLEGVNNQIKSAVESNGQTLTDIKNTLNANLPSMNSKLTTIADNTGGILDHLTTTNEVDIPNISSPTVPQSDNRGSKPSQPTQSFTDTTDRFNDAGDAPMPDALPDTPNPTDCWDKTGTCKENELVKEGEKTKDSELQRETELNTDLFAKDPFTLDPELTKDTYTPDAPYTRDNILNTDTFAREGELTQDTYTQTPTMTTDGFSQTPEMSADTYSQDNNYSETNQYGQTHQYSQTPVDTTLPDWTN